MARRAALLQPAKSLRARRAELSARLAGAAANLHDFKSGDSTGDVADAAFERESGELSGQLQNLEARDLGQIERALACWPRGAYGTCENCQKQISLARLTILPHATLCIKCERDWETHPDSPQRRGADSRARPIDSEARVGSRRINFTEMEMGFAGSRRR